MEIMVYQELFEKQVIELILRIQQDEYQVPITLEDQPDLKRIPESYQTTGNFWVAIEGGKVIGTIALLNLNNHIGTIRKLFVDSAYRGQKHGVSSRLLETLLTWSADHQFQALYLGTTSLFKAAHRFYEKNGFTSIGKDDLPIDFPLVAVDTVFYRYRFDFKAYGDESKSP